MHTRHEDVISEMAEQADPYFVETLIKLVHWTPDYLLWDTDARALSKRVIYALSDLKEKDAQAKLELRKISENYSKFYNCKNAYLSGIATDLLKK